MSWTLFWQLFNPNIPMKVWGPLVVVLIIAITVTLLKAKHKTSWIIAELTIAYLFLILYTTLLHRTPGTEHLYNWTPFWSIDSIREGYIETLYEKLYNILLFIPLGIFMGYFFRKQRFLKYLGIITIIGAGFSLSIELLQLLTKTGMCETDDILCNTLGIILGGMVMRGTGEVIG